MILDGELLKEVEAELENSGVLDDFEDEYGPIRGRMEITVGEFPEDVASEEQTGDVTVFLASFDFYDSILGLGMQLSPVQVATRLWVTPQREGVEAPPDDLVELFVKTLAEHIDSNGGFSYPMFTFLSEEGEFTKVVPAK